MTGETVVILRAGLEYDPYSDTYTPSWDAEPTETPVQTLAPPEPRPSGEPLEEARNAVVSGWTLYLPTGTDVTSQDRVRVRGVVYLIDGEPASWPRGLVLQSSTTAG